MLRLEAELSLELRSRLVDESLALFQLSTALVAESRDPVVVASHALLIALLLDSRVETPLHCTAALLEREIQRALSLMEETALAPSLIGGYLGVAWMLNVAASAGRRPGQALDDFEIDAALADDIPRLQHEGIYDFYEGIAGALWFELHRPRGARPNVIQARLEALASVAKTTDEGIGWWTPPDRARHPELNSGYFDLGFVHGQAGVITVLSKVCTQVPSTLASSILTHSLAGYDAMVAQQPGHFVEHTTIGGDVPRHAWCYGTPGVSIAMLAAATARRDQKRARRWIAKLTLALEDDPSRARIDSPGFCHGSAGAAHIALTAARRWGAPTTTLATRWLLHTVDLITRSDFRASLTPFADGIVWISLVLLSAPDVIDPSWGELLGVSWAPATSVAAGTL